MSKLNLHLLYRSNANDIETFIGFWQKLYSYGKENLYSENIDAKTLDKGNIEKLYEWKNGTPLSKLKEISVREKIIEKLDKINDFRAGKSWNIDEFHHEFKSVSAVWRIFLLHIIKPSMYPIYDQHVHRSYQYLNGLPTDGINSEIKDRVKLEFYGKEYLPFVKSLKVSDLKKMDEAFFAFGQFLNTGAYKRMIV